jgi:hypothetical protein
MYIYIEGNLDCEYTISSHTSQYRMSWEALHIRFDALFMGGLSSLGIVLHIASMPEVNLVRLQ